MTSGEFILEATKTLANAGIQTARLDVLILLSDTLKQDKASILAHPEHALTAQQLTHLERQVLVRAEHMPLAYIRGTVMFFGREFSVTPSVLVPRPESETIIELLIRLPLPAKPQIADIGTGSGCIGLTAALELPQAQVDLYDIDKDALQVAEHNNSVLKAGAHVMQNDLLNNISKRYDVVLANLPYVPDHFPINEAAKREPKIALFSGSDGLDHYRTFWGQIAALKEKPAYILIESLPSQHHALAMLARHAGYYLEKTQDFIQLFAVL